MKHIHVFLILAIIGIAAYANSFQNDFLWDDEYLITNNTHVQAPSVKHALLFFKDNLGKYGQDNNNFYRPFQELSYMLDYAVWKLNPVGFHLGNLMLHLLAAFLLFLIAEQISGNQVIALISSSIYLIHPLHTEAVTYIAGRADPLMALFFLLSFYLYLRRKSALSCLSFVCALLSKEIAIMLPVILIFYGWVFEAAEDRKKKWQRYVPYLAIVAVYAALRTTVLNFRHPVADIPAGVGLYERVLTSFRVFKEYFRLIILPFDLHMERVLVFSKSIFEPEVFISALILAVVIISTFLLKKRHKLAFFGLGWFFITIFPLSNIPFALNATLAEHWLYIPLIGASIAAGYGLVALGRAISVKGYLSGKITAILTICFIAYFSVLTIGQNAKWRDGETLYTYTLRYAGDSPRLHYNLGNAYRKAGQLAEAAQAYRASIAIDPTFHSSHFNLGLCYVATGNTNAAISEFKKAIELEPSHYKSYVALGLSYRDESRFDEAIAQYKKAIEIDSNYPEAYNNLGDVYFRRKMHKEAEQEFRRALAINPAYVEAWNNLGVSLVSQGRREEAVAAWNKSLQINPDQPIIKQYIGRNRN